MLRSADTTKDVKILHVAGGVLWVGGAKAMYIYDCEVRCPASKSNLIFLSFYGPAARLQLTLLADACSHPRGEGAHSPRKRLRVDRCAAVCVGLRRPKMHRVGRNNESRRKGAGRSRRKGTHLCSICFAC